MAHYHIRYFAILREQAGIAQERVESNAQTPGELYAELVTKRGLQVPLSLVRPVVNTRYVGPEALLSDGDQVVFVPPVAGG